MSQPREISRGMLCTSSLLYSTELCKLMQHRSVSYASLVHMPQRRWSPVFWQGTAQHQQSYSCWCQECQRYQPTTAKAHAQLHTDEIVTKCRLLIILKDVTVTNDTKSAHNIAKKNNQQNKKNLRWHQIGEQRRKKFIKHTHTRRYTVLLLNIVALSSNECQKEHTHWQ